MAISAGKMSNASGQNSQGDHNLSAGNKVKCMILKDSPGNVMNHSLQHVDYDEMTTSDDKMNDFGTSKG